MHLGHESHRRPPGSHPPNSFHGRPAVLLPIGGFFDAFGAISIAVALTVITHYLHVDLAESGLIVSTGCVGQLVGALVADALTEKLGGRKVFAVSLAAFGLLSIGAALARSCTSLLMFLLVAVLGSTVLVGTGIETRSSALEELAR
ncbi:MFS transporter [Streptomyces sp. NPDC002588]|uniref:MFS transporter n=1 Tax=Streptomyces sp. NPDC002588 TaxID=3154419 RepID=UPI00331B3610